MEVGGVLSQGFSKRGGSCDLGSGYSGVLMVAEMTVEASSLIGNCSLGACD